MSKYAVKHGAIFKIADIDEVAPKLPKGTYNLSFDGMSSSYYLEKTSDLEIPKKIYGDMSLIDRIIKVYKHKDRNVGLLLYGLKGSGKYILNVFNLLNIQVF